MQIHIVHHTLYRYAMLDGLILQALRLWPRDSSALATPSPDMSETGRSLDQPPIRTAM